MKSKQRKLKKRIRQLEQRLTALEHSIWWQTPSSEMPAELNPRDLWAEVIVDYDKVVDTGWDDEWDEIPPQRNGYL